MWRAQFDARDNPRLRPKREKEEGRGEFVSVEEEQMRGWCGCADFIELMEFVRL